MVQNSMDLISLRCCPAVALPSPCRHLTPPFACHRHHRTATAIAISVVVIVIPIYIAATTNTVLPTANSVAAVRAHCCCCRVRGPISGVVDDNDAVVADAPGALPLPPSGAADPTAAATMKTLDGTIATGTSTAEMATATEEEECNGKHSTNPRRCLDDSLLRLTDGILLCSITATTVGAAARRRRSPATTMMSMPAIDINESKNYLIRTKVHPTLGMTTLLSD
jgi:hypothetical protein